MASYFVGTISTFCFSVAEIFAGYTFVDLGAGELILPTLLDLLPFLLHHLLYLRIIVLILLLRVLPHLLFQLL